MRRHTVHISAALLAFTVGFLTVGKVESLAVALPLALAVFVLAKMIPGLDVDLHFLWVLALSLLMWAAGAYALLSGPLTSGGSCVVEFSVEEAKPATALPDDGRMYAPVESQNQPLPGITACSCVGANVGPAAFNAGWAGVVNRKAISKPAPVYPPVAKAASLSGTVAVSVIVDESGKVVWAQAISGHPLLRQAALDAACRARFSPVPADGPPVRASGILTYDFIL